MLFTTFTRELAQRVNLSPRYIDRRANELNEALWRLVKSFFLRYNETNSDSVFVIDEEAKTVTATEYQELPVLFYYWTGSRNRPYRSQKRYGMGGGFKPRAGRITFSSVIGQDILHELDKLVPVGVLLEREAEKFSPAQAEELERMKLRCNGQKAALARKLDWLEVQVKALETERDAITGDRLKRLALEKEVTRLRRELMKGRESQFFDAMRLDVELEEQVKKFAEQEKLTAKVTREFVVEGQGGNLKWIPWTV